MLVRLALGSAPQEKPINLSKLSSDIRRQSCWRLRFLSRLCGYLNTVLAAWRQLPRFQKFDLCFSLEFINPVNESGEVRSLTTKKMLTMHGAGIRVVIEALYGFGAGPRRSSLQTLLVGRGFAERWVCFPEGRCGNPGRCPGLR